jgi:hypothetical protein
MIERALSNRASPKTQSIDAVKALLALKKVSSDPLPEFVVMDKEDLRLVLVLSNKRDCYYVTSARALVPRRSTTLGRDASIAASTSRR